MQIFAILPIFKLLCITIRRTMVYIVQCTHLFNDLNMCTNVLITNNTFISLGKLYQMLHNIDYPLSDRIIYFRKINSTFGRNIYLISFHYDNNKTPLHNMKGYSNNKIKLSLIPFFYPKQQSCIFSIIERYSLHPTTPKIMQYFNQYYSLT